MHLNAGNMWLVERPNFRQARAADKERLIELEGQAYPSPATYDERKRAIFTHHLGDLKDFIVGEIAGEIVAQAFLFRLTTFYGGLPVKTGGIASVAVAPEARGRGFATAMMDHIHLLSSKRGNALTMLYAFRQGFYARIGYTPASSRKRLIFDARSVPSEWNGPVRRVLGKDRRLLEQLYARVVRSSSGVHERSKATWDRIFAHEKRIVFVTEDGNGYIAFELRQEESHAETRIVVDELVAADAEARRSLIGAIGRMRDQASTIEYEVAEDDPLERALVDPDARRWGSPDREHSLGEIVGGPMVRIGALALALTARGYLEDGSFALDVDGERLTVRAKNGRAEIVKPRKGLPELATTRRGLAAVLYGGLGVDDAVALGLAKADAAVDSILRLPPVIPFDAF